MKKIILSIIACIAMTTAYAQVTLTIENVNYEKGQDGQFDVMVQSEADLYSSFRMYIYVPEGLNTESKKSKVIVDGEAYADNIDNESWNYQFTVNAPTAEVIPGYKSFLLQSYDVELMPMKTSTKTRLFSVKYLASDIEKLSVILKKVDFSPASADPNQIVKIEEVTYTGIKGINADKDEVANDGKFVENNRVVIKKAGVKYSTTGQVIK